MIMGNLTSSSNSSQHDAAENTTLSEGLNNDRCLIENGEKTSNDQSEFPTNLEIDKDHCTKMLNGSELQGTLRNDVPPDPKPNKQICNSVTKVDQQHGNWSGITNTYPLSAETSVPLKTQNVSLQSSVKDAQEEKDIRLTGHSSEIQQKSLSQPVEMLLVSDVRSNVDLNISERINETEQLGEAFKGQEQENRSSGITKYRVLQTKPVSIHPREVDEPDLSERLNTFTSTKPLNVATTYENVGLGSRQTPCPNLVKFTVISSKEPQKTKFQSEILPNVATTNLQFEKVKGTAMPLNLCDDSKQVFNLEHKITPVPNIDTFYTPLKTKDKAEKGTIEDKSSTEAFVPHEPLSKDNKTQNIHSSQSEKVEHTKQQNKPYRVKRDGRWQSSPNACNDLECEVKQLRPPRKTDELTESGLQHSCRTFGSSWRDRKTNFQPWSHAELPVNTRADALRSASCGKSSTYDSRREWKTNLETKRYDHRDWRSKQDREEIQYLNEDIKSDSSDDDIILEVMLPGQESNFATGNIDRRKQLTDEPKQQRESKTENIQVVKRNGSKSRLSTCHSLRKLIGMDSKSILTELTKSEIALNECIKKCTVDTDHLETFLHIIAEAYTCEKIPHAVIMLFESLKENKFFDLLVLFLIDLQDRMTDKADIIKNERVLKHILRTIVTQITRNPSSVSVFSRIHTVIGQIVVELSYSEEHVLDEEIRIQFKQFTEHKKATEMILKSNSGKQKSNQPPEDFRIIQVLPSPNEIKGAIRPFLRANKIEGEYDDLDHYLDVQFRLLREDFVGPLREGISEYIKSNKDNRKDTGKSNTDVKIYNGRVRSPVITEHGFCYQIQLEMTPRLRRLNWSISKRLIYGSLICLTEDDFSTFTLATVVGRDEEDIKLGLFTVLLEENISTEELLHKPFKIAETSAYFESYRHVLAGLQAIKAGDLPFENYIVYCENKSSPPAYVTPETLYDLRPLVDQHAKIYGQRLLPDIGVTRKKENVFDYDVDAAENQSEQKEFNFSSESEAAKNVNILEVSKWPTKEILHLDESQYKAIQTALTKEFSIIQGPPGTGKTYVGLQIARALLQNRCKWEPPANSENSAQPILIVCYTNHALDQFLEGIHTFFKGDILRVGGRSKSDVLQNCNLRKYRQCHVGSGDTHDKLKRIRIEAKEKLDECSQNVRLWAKSVELYQREIVHENFLFPEMSSRFYDNLVTGHGNREQKLENKSLILKWLGITHMISMVRRQSRKQSQECAFVNVEDEYTTRRGSDLFDEEDIALSWTDRYLVGNIRKKAIAFYVEDVFIPEANFKTEHVSDEIRKLRREKDFRRNLKRTLQTVLSSQDIMTQDEANSIADIWRIDPIDRWRLYRMWVKQLCDSIFSKIERQRPDFEAASERYRDAILDEDKEIMRHASVIGMTTSGAAKYQSVLREIEPKIIIVEEAAEVLEAHIVTTLSKGCEHLILIGDHKQLRPNPTVYRLAVRYNLNISLFERMVKNGINFNSLEIQHRMRPEIAYVIRHIYTGLKDHEVVKTYPNVKGVSTNIYFITHEHMENKDEDLRSYSNVHEADFVTSLFRYLLQQGYQSKQITVLTTYTGQLMCIRSCMPREEFGSVKVTVVDNYQGEENDIVLLSLVRSNQDDKIGFLKVENRICVALSRAKVGFYVIGNFCQLARNSDLWESMVQNLEENGHYGNGLKLFCQNHPTDDAIIAREGKDFKKAPNGGCSKKCEARLQCGHVCEMFCHVENTDHKLYMCRKPCQRVICEQHSCPYPCYEPCEPCSVLVTKTIPTCSHEQRVMCSVEASKVVCDMPCDAQLPCQHLCTNLCGESHTMKCLVQVEYTLPCGHTVLTECYRTALDIECIASCQALLKCEHPCEGTCGNCFRGRVHIPCKQKCKRLLVCGHECLDFCNNCPPCKANCENRCVHSVCQNRCGELCVQCQEPCEWNCIHFQCNQVCSEPCDRPRCNEPCEKDLPCGHPCLGLCGEPCAAFFCRVCDYDTVAEILFGDEDNPNARFVYLEDCGHNIEAKAMDMYMDMKDELEAVQLKGCPRCKTPIRKCLRYGTVVKDNLKTIEQVKQAAFATKSSIDNLNASLNVPGLFSLSATGNDSMLALRFARRVRAKLRNGTYTVLTNQQLVTMKNQNVLFIALAKIKSDIKIQGKSISLLDKDKLLAFFSKLTEHIQKERASISEQELDDYKKEIQRGFTYVRFLKLQKAVKRAGKEADATTHIETVEYILTLPKKYTDDMAKNVEEEFERLTELTKIEGLGINEEERLEIVKAVGLSKDHWFKCPNNHIYAIGECGGAMQRGRCPECKADIGGESHRLTERNKLAPEMDGAPFAAYSEEANNMANFDLNNLH